MAGDNHGDKAQEVAETAQDNGHEQAAQEQPQVSSADWEKVIAERDEKIAALEAQMAEAAKNAETVEQLRGKIAELKAQGESDRIDFKLQLAGARNVKATRAILADHGGEVDALKEAEPWLFADAPAKQPGGKTGLLNAGTSTDAGKTMRRWRRLAGLDNDNRTWFYAHFYEDGEGVLAVTSTPDATRTLRATGGICTIGKYVGLGFTPWTA